MRAPERVRRFQLFYPSLSALTADQRRALTEQRFDQLQGAILPDRAGGWRYQLEGAVFYNQDRIPENEALLNGLSDIRSAAVIADLTYVTTPSRLQSSKTCSDRRASGPRQSPGC